MKLIFKALAAGVLLAAAASNANAITIQFSCTGDQSNSACTQSGSGGGTTSAILNFTQTTPNTLQVVVDNTSPDFTPALLAFGFFVDPDGATLDATNPFTASAFQLNVDFNGDPILDSNGDPTFTSTDITSLWSVDQSSTGLNADFVANNGSGVQDGLYNPDIIGQPAQDLTAPNPFFTTAIFTFNFNQAVSLVLDDTGDISSGLVGSTFVRFQNVGPPVGPDGEPDGSTKIACSINDTACTPTVVPEPGMLGLLGGSLICIGFLARRRRFAV